MPSEREISQAVFDGISTGAYYAVTALAFSVLWATVRTVNLALIQVVAIGAITTALLAPQGAVVALLGACVAGLVAGVATHYTAVATTVRHGFIAPVIATLGVGLVLEGLMSVTVGDNTRAVDVNLPDSSVTLLGAQMTWPHIIVLGVITAVLVGYGIIARLTPLGLAFRATAWNRELADAYGVNVRRVQFVSASGAALVAGLTGWCIAVVGGNASPVTGAEVGLYGILAMLIGGAGNPVGAVLGGLTVGLINSFGATIVSSSVQSQLSLGLIFCILILRPTGLLKGV